MTRDELREALADALHDALQQHPQTNPAQLYHLADAVLPLVDVYVKNTVAWLATAPDEAKS